MVTFWSNSPSCMPVAHLLNATFHSTNCHNLTIFPSTILCNKIPSKKPLFSCLFVFLPSIIISFVIGLVLVENFWSVERGRFGPCLAWVRWNNQHWKYLNSLDNFIYEKCKYFTNYDIYWPPHKMVLIGLNIQEGTGLYESSFHLHL